MCIDIMLTPATDGSLLSVRTLEFGSNLDVGGLQRSAGTQMVSLAPDGSEGLEWTVKYSYVGFEAFHSLIEILTQSWKMGALVNQLFTFDGMNTEGLTCGSLWHDTAEYQAVPDGSEKKALLWLYFCDWVLGNCASVDDVKNALADNQIYVWAPEKLTALVPFHFPIHDKDGNSIVVEFVYDEDKGASVAKVYDNPVGVCANAPDFPWHLENIRNYTQLTPNTDKETDYNGLAITNFWSGQDMSGLPGGYTSPERFIRGFMLKNFARQAESSSSLLVTGIHVLNALDIVRGIATYPNAFGGLDVDSCYIASLRDPLQQKYYIRTYDNPDVYMIDLKEIKFSEFETETFSLNPTFTPTDITGKNIDTPNIYSSAGQ